MPKLTLTYLAVQGRGEGIRMLLEHTGTPYENVVLQLSEHGARKEEWPLGQLPILEVDGVELVQTGAILEYIARLNNMGPTDPLQAATCQSVFLSVNEADPSSAMVALNLFDDEKFRAAAVTYREAIKKYLTFFTTALDTKPYFHGDKPGYADFYVFAQLEVGLALAPDMFSGYPSMASWYERVKGLEAVTKYIAARGPTIDRSAAIEGL